MDNRSTIDGSTSDTFTVILPSNTPSFSSHVNKHTDFETSLQRSIEFADREYEVALSEIWLPHRRIPIKFKLFLVAIQSTRLKTAYRMIPITLKRVQPTPRLPHYDIGLFDDDNKPYNRMCSHPLCYASAGYTKTAEILKTDVMERVLSNKLPNHTVQSEVILPEYPTNSSSIFLDQMTDFSEFFSKHLNNLFEKRRSEVRGYFNLVFHPLIQRRLTYNHHQAVFLLPDMEDSETVFFFKQLNYSPELFKEFISFKYGGMCLPVKDFYKIYPDIIDVQMNIVSSDTIGDTPENLLRRIRRPTVYECCIQFKELHWLPVKGKSINSIHVKLTSLDRYEDRSNENAHVYDKCQVALKFRRKV